MQKKNFGSKVLSLGKVLAFSAVLVSLAAPAIAADFKFNDNQKNQNLDIPADVVSKNLYTAGAQVTVNASPIKDLVAAGAMVMVNGNVGDDLIAVAGNLNIKGSVGGSARVAGGNVYIDSPTIGEDLLVGGGTVYIHSGTTINGDLIIGSGSVVFDGHVLGNIKFAGGSLTINGKVDGNVDATTSQIISLGSHSEIKGNFNYTAPSNTLQRDPGATILGHVNFTPKAPVRNGFGAMVTVVMIIRLIAALVVAVLMLTIFKKRFVKTIETVGNNFWKNVGLGLVGMIVVPVVIALLFITIIGYYLAFILIAWFALSIMVSGIVGAAYFGSWLVAKIDRKEIKIDYVTVILGVVLFYVLRFIPLIGWAFAAIIVMAGFGAMLRLYNQTRRQE